MAEYMQNETLLVDKSNYERATDIDCPTCNKEKLHVRSDLDGTVQLECPNCLYVENKPSDHVKEMTDIRGRPLKPPK